MADLDLEQLDNDIEKDNKVEKRIKDLSEKVRLTSDERDELKKKIEESSKTQADLQRERDFYQGFSDVVSTNPAAKDHKDDILAKVRGGYSVEDATYAVLGKAGKLGQVKPEVKVENPAGGSATTQPSLGGPDKKIEEMTRDEKRNIILEATKRGDISLG